MDISPDVLFPYVKRGLGENDPPEDERFLSIRPRNERIDVIDFNISKLTSDIRGRGRRLSGRRMGSKLKRYANQVRELIVGCNRRDGSESSYWVQIDE